MLSTLNSIQKRQLNKALKAAKEYLVTSEGFSDAAWKVNETHFICVAISFAYRDNKITLTQKYNADLFITKCLNYEPTVISWLRKNVPEAEPHMTPQSIQAYRHRWVAHLIQETEGY